MLKIVVICPGGLVSGGVEALNQLVYTANLIRPGSAAICYWPFSVKSPVPKQYLRYANPEIGCGEIPTSALVVLPEIYPEISKVLPNRCALWWLSVDNFGAHGQRDISNIDLHLCQSHYAWLHTESLGERLMLTDWVEVKDVAASRSQRVVVNPAKDAGLMKPSLLDAPFEVIPLSGYSPDQAAYILRSSTIYIDFGHHPGRDRIPREAALAGCVVLSTRLGAAQFREDMPLPAWSFFSTPEEVRQRISAIHSGALDAVAEQSDYRAWVTSNRSVFEDEVRILLEYV